jgi:hypothetical protein
MNRGAKSSNQSNKKQPQSSQQQQVTQKSSDADHSSISQQQAPSVQSNVNPEKMQQIQDKVRELEHLLKIKDMSDQMAGYFDELAKSVEGLAGGAQGMYHCPVDILAFLNFNLAIAKHSN